MKIIIKFIILIILLCPSLISDAQKLEETKASAEFEQTEVNSNGTMAKSIPIANISNEHLNVNLNLNYTGGGGIKVGELSSRAGLGWQLGGVGSISRKVMGIPDEGYFREESLTITSPGNEDTSVEFAAKQVNGWLLNPKYNPDTEEQFLASKEALDTEPDIFSYQAGGYSGQFYFAHDAQGDPYIVNMNGNNVLIEFLPSYITANGQNCGDYLTNCDCQNNPPIGCPTPNNPCQVGCLVYDACFEDYNNCVEGESQNVHVISLTFTITTPDGQVYYFGGTDTDGDLLEEKSLVYAKVDFLSDRTLNVPITNVWFLKKISSQLLRQSKNDITFNYGVEAYSYKTVGTQVRYINPLPGNQILENVSWEEDECLSKYFPKEQVLKIRRDNDDDISYQSFMYSERSDDLTVEVNTLRLEAVNSKYQLIDLLYDTNREDLNYSAAFESSELIQQSTANRPQRLAGINTYVGQNIQTGELISDIEFNHSYYNSGSPNIPENKRLILNSFSQKNLVNTSEKLTTTFTYNLNGFGGDQFSNLPSRLSFAQDYWGYYNGENANSVLIPLLPVELANNSFLSTCHKVAKRQPEFPEMQYGSLKSISISSGASIEYEYGAHLVNNYPADKIFKSTTGENIVGGLRLERTYIVDNDNISENDISTIYKYEFEDETSSGKILNVPTFTELWNNDFKIHTSMYSSSDPCNQQHWMETSGRIYSSSITPSINGEMQHVGYERVVMEFENSENGSSESLYYMPTDQEILSYNLEDRSFPIGRVAGGNEISTGIQKENFLRRGLMTQQNVYTQSKTLAQSKINTFSVRDVNTVDFKQCKHEYGGMPFKTDWKFSDRVKLFFGASFGDVRVMINTFTIDDDCAAANIDFDTDTPITDGQHNALGGSNAILLGGRIQLDETMNFQDGVTTITNYQYDEKEVTYNGITKKVVLPVRTETYTECDTATGDDCTKNVKSAKVTYYPISSKYESTDTYHDANDPINNVAQLFINNYLVAMPIEQQQWINTEGTYKMIEAAKSTYIVNGNNIVPKTTFSFSGSKWEVASNNTAWDANTGMPTITYMARQDALDNSDWTTTYKDWTVDFTKFNPDPVINTYQDGLLSSTKKQDSSNSANNQETTYTYHDTRLVESETSPEGTVAYTAYDGFLQKSKVIAGIAATDFTAGQIPTTGRVTQDFTYEIKGLLVGQSYPFNTNKTIFTTTFENGATETLSHLVSQTDELLKDELGRDVSVIKKNYTPSNNDLIAQTNQYNHLGKVKESFTVGKGISIMEYEKSFINRLSKIESNEISNAVDTEYGYNDNAVDGSIIIGGKTYNNHSLFKQTVTDIDGDVSILFTDFLGRSILSRQIMNENGNSVYVDTGYEYDNKGRLSKIFPPDGTPYEYSYNNWGLMASKTVPNGGTTRYYYDYEFRLVLEVDAKGNEKVSVFDDFGRPIKTGTNAVFTVDNSEVAFTTSDEITRLFEVNQIKPSDEHYTVTYHPGTNYMASEVESILDASNTISKTTLTKTYTLADYDAELGLPTRILSEHHLNDGTQKDEEFIEYNDAGEIWRSVLTHYDANNNSKMFIWTTKYDNGNRPTEVYFSNTISNLGQLISKIDYNEKDQMEKRSLHSTGTDFLQEINYVYDGLGRLTDINDMDDYGNFNCATQTYCDLVISFENDNCAGFTLTKLKNGVEEDFQLSNSGFCPNQNSAETFITSLKQDLDNAGFIYDDVEVEWQDSPNLPQYVLYTIVITQSNAPFYKFTPPDNRTGLVQKNSCCGLNESQDLFAQRITYDNNGNSLNIGRIEWNTLCGDLQSYDYEYDDLKRLRFARYTQQDAAGNITGYTPGTTTTNLDGLFSVQVNYENNIGNIGQIYRNGLEGQIDAIDFSYVNGQLKSTREYADRTKGHKSITNNGVNNYSYDNNGNIIKDTGKGLGMRYTYFNLPDRITRYNDILTFGDEDYTYFDYTGSGRKLRKSTSLAIDVVAKNAEPSNTKDYVGSIEYRNGKLDAYYHPDGMLKFNADGTYQYQYYIKDHLGNNRTVFTDTYNDDIVGSNDIIQENHHYPFGLQMNNNEETLATENQYKYNGKEINEELGLDWMAYGFRFYDASIARFTGVDPIADQFNFVNVYNYAENSPVANNDLYGLQKLRGLEQMRPPIDQEAYLNNRIIDVPFGSTISSTNTTSKMKFENYKTLEKNFDLVKIDRLPVLKFQVAFTTENSTKNGLTFSMNEGFDKYSVRNESKAYFKVVYQTQVNGVDIKVTGKFVVAEAEAMAQIKNDPEGVAKSFTSDWKKDIDLQIAAGKITKNAELVGYLKLGTSLYENSSTTTLAGGGKAQFMYDQKNNTKVKAGVIFEIFYQSETTSRVYEDPFENFNYDTP